MAIVKMEELNIEAGETTPKVQYSPATHSISISGSCFPSNAFELFEPIFAWMDTNLGTLPQECITFVGALNYINTSSTKQLYQIVDRLKQQFSDNLKLVWVYEDQDEEMEQIGSDLADLMSVPAMMVPTYNLAI